MKQLVFTLLYWTGLTRMMSRRTCRQVKILCYHSITRNPPAPADQFKLHLPEKLFRTHLNYLRGRYQVISLREYVEAQHKGRELPENTVILTFDDGFRNFHTVAVPLLAEFGFPATVFVITGKTEESALPEQGRWQLSDDTEHLTWPETQLLAAQGLQIGSHTHTHQRLPELTLPEARRDMSDSLQALAAHLGESHPPLSYPHGQMSYAVKLLAEELGHSCALSSELGGNGPDADLYALRRIVIASDDNVAAFAARVAGLTWNTPTLRFADVKVDTPPVNCPD
jgi:peptidoglycan/xylan/chitin deacetylase (PgdA/CDA1 family)